MNDQPHNRWWNNGWFLGLLLIAVTLVAYQPAWKGEPVYDDEDHLTRPDLLPLNGLARIWTELGVVSQYYPITHTAFWVQQHVWGDSMLGYHLVNIFLHAGCAVLLMCILNKLEIPGAWLAAAIFALHPVHVESVAWISELKNTLSTLFYLGAALIYLKFDATRRKGFYLVAFALFALGLLSKSVIASLPAALLIVFWWRRGRLSWKQDVQPLLPFFFVGIITGLFTAWMERKFIGAEGESFDLSIIERCLIAGRVVWFYLGKLFWPANLTFIYPRWQVSQTVWWQYLFPVAALALLTVLWTLRRRWRGPLAALLLFGGALFPVMGFLNVYPFRYSFVADHYQYLASLAVITAVSAGAAMLLGRVRLWERPAGNVLCVVLLVALATLTWRQSHMYTNVETLWRTTIERNPGCFVAHGNLGNYLLQTGHVDEAIHHCRTALKLEPKFAEIHSNLGNALLEKGQIDEAMLEYQEALRLQPDFAVGYHNLGAVLLRKNRKDEAISRFQKAIELRPDYTQARHSLGNVLLEEGRAGEAIVHFEKAIEFQPDNAELHFKLGNALLQKGRVNEAIGHFHKAVELRPNQVMLRHHLAMALQQSGQTSEAITQFRKIVELEPDGPNAHNNLGWILRETWKLDEAIVEFRKALELRPDYSEAHNNLGKALFLKGRVSEAITHYRTAIKLQPDNARALSNLAWVLATSPDASLRNGSEAIQLAERASQLMNEQHLETLRGLAAAYAEGGKFEAAVKITEKSVELAVTQHKAVLTEALRGDLKLYRAGSSLRDFGAGVADNQK